MVRRAAAVLVLVGLFGGLLGGAYLWSGGRRGIRRRLRPSERVNNKARRQASGGATGVPRVPEVKLSRAT